MQLYSLLLGVFASLVAPFGGFFASAIKRAYDAKDFDTFIPGHGGLMDRFDCQFIMALCTCTFCNTLWTKEPFTAAGVLTAFKSLDSNEQMSTILAAFDSLSIQHQGALLDSLHAKFGNQ